VEAQCKCDTTKINHTSSNACTDVFRRPEADFRAFSPEVQARKIDNINSLIYQRIRSTGTYPAMTQPHNDQGSVDEAFHDYVPEELIEQPDNSFNRLRRFVAATEASMPFSAVLPMGRSAITSSSQPIPCSNSNSNSNDITNMTRVENA
jgi:hypothetical protein